MAATVLVGAAKVKVQADFDKTVDFTGVHTWAWYAEGAGDVKMARSSEDDPVPIQRRFGPTIVDAVAKEFALRKLTAVTEAPDVRIHYYLLVTVGFDTQITGQFLPPVAAWGVPPFTPSTSSYKITQNGALVLDAVSTKLNRVVWRGIAQTEIDQAKNDDQRDARIRDVVHELVAKFPPKK